jgi:hemoglobin
MRTPVHLAIATAFFLTAGTLPYAAEPAAAVTSDPAANFVPAPGSFYADLGGLAGIRKFTHALVVMLVEDPRTRDKFEDADMDRLEVLLVEQFCDLSGGPCHYSGKDMRAAHAHKEIGIAQFNALAEDLQIAMEQNQVPSAAANKLVAKLAPMAHDVVTR